MNIDLQTCETCGVSMAMVDEALSIGQENKVQIDELVQTLITAHNKTSRLETFFHGELVKMKAQRDEARSEASEWRHIAVMLESGEMPGIYLSDEERKHDWET